MRPQACNLYEKLSSHHPLKCLSGISAVLGPGSFLPCLDCCCLICSVTFCLCGGGDCSSGSLIKDGVPLCLGDSSGCPHTSVTPPVLTQQPTVGFLSKWLAQAGIVGTLGPNWCGQSILSALSLCILTQLASVIKPNLSIPYRNTSKITLKYINLWIVPRGSPLSRGYHMRLLWIFSLSRLWFEMHMQQKRRPLCRS